MQPLQFVVPLDSLAAVESLIPYVVLALVLANMVTRGLAHRSQAAEAAAEDAESVSRFAPHTVTSLLLILASFAFMIVEPHGGMVMSVLIIGLFLTDLFEFESRQVEVRNDMEFERPKASVAASVIVLLYAGFQSLFFVVQPIWSLIV